MFSRLLVGGTVVSGPCTVNLLFLQLLILNMCQIFLPHIFSKMANAFKLEKQAVTQPVNGFSHVLCALICIRDEQKWRRRGNYSQGPCTFMDVESKLPNLASDHSCRCRSPSCGMSWLGLQCLLTKASPHKEQFVLILFCDTFKSLRALLVADVLVICRFILSPLCRSGKVKLQSLRRICCAAEREQSGAEHPANGSWRHCIQLL